MAVGAVLADDDVRPERGGQRGHDRTNRRQPRLGAACGLQRDVDRRGGRNPLPHLGDGSRPGE